MLEDPRCAQDARAMTCAVLTEVQVPKNVVSRVVDYLLNTNVQMGADYPVSQVATRRVMVEGPTAAKVSVPLLDTILHGELIYLKGPIQRGQRRRDRPRSKFDPEHREPRTRPLRRCEDRR